MERLRVFFGTYTRAEQDWAFQLWLDAWAEAARRPVAPGHLAAAQRRVAAVAGRGDRGRGRAPESFTCADPARLGWRILSLLDGLALQTVAHRVAVDRDVVIAWSTAYAERELGLSPGTLG